MGTPASLEDVCIMALEAGQLWAVYSFTHSFFICIYLIRGPRRAKRGQSRDPQSDE